MKRIEIGTLLKTNYGTGPYRVVGIIRGCTCTHFLDEIENVENPLPPHLHMWLRYVSKDHNEGKEAWLAYYDEDTLRSVAKDCKDRLFLLESPEPIQTSLELEAPYGQGDEEDVELTGIEAAIRNYRPRKKP